MSRRGRSPFWVPPLVPVPHWGRLCVGPRAFQFVVTTRRSDSCIAFYREPFTRYLGCGFFPNWRLSGVPFLEVREMAEALLAKLLRGAQGTVKCVASHDADFRKRYVSLHELMTACVNEDSSARKTSSLLIFTEDGVWKGCLTERDLDISLWASGPTFSGMLLAMEERLNADQVEWRRKNVRNGKR